MRHSRQSTTDLKRFFEAHILGAVSRRRLEQVGQHWKAGTTDPRNGTTFWTDCLNVSMEQLLENTEMTRLFTEVT